MKRFVAIIGLCLTAPIPAHAQAAASAATNTVTTPDPARIAAARKLIDTLLPPSTRQQMIQGMIMPLLANIQRGVTSDPEFAKSFASDPRAKALFEKFMQKQNDRVVEQMATALPGMATAMANAYARRFDLNQMRELQAFFETPTGRAYMQASYTIMSDPDIAAWQQSLMSQSLSRVQGDIAEFAKAVAALGPPAGAKP